MNYELSKELKDAGFSQTAPAEYTQEDSHLTYLTETPSIENCARVPTLSELIEAFAGCFFKLTHTSTDVLWTAETLTEKAVGETLEEAVARLWLALSEKK